MLSYTYGNLNHLSIDVFFPYDPFSPPSYSYKMIQKWISVKSKKLNNTIPC